jgi:chromosome segregation ATPase
MCFPLTQGLKEQLGTEELFLNFSFKTQKQMQTTIDGLTKREETNNQTVQELREKQEQFQTAIDEQTNREEANNRTVQELREKQEQFQTTIDEQTKALQPDVSKCKVVAVTPSKWNETIRQSL